ncbi:penicillin-binding transpeptidase domain-containing protein [Corynebacterium sp. ZY180755]
MKKQLSLLLTTSVVCSGLVACTPKPASVDPVVEDFLNSIENRDVETASSLTDSSALASVAINDTWTGLQAEGLDAQLDSVDLNDTVATATYTMNWDLPRNRDLSYQASMTLTRFGDDWTISWHPSVLHPELSTSQHLELRAINAERASVVSSDGADILVPGTVYRLLVDLDQVTDLNPTVNRIVTVVNAAHERDSQVQRLNAEELSRNLKDASGRFSVMTINEREGVNVKNELANTPGIIMNPEAAMVNIDPDFAPDIISRVALVVEEELEGANGWEIATVTPDGVAMKTLERHEAEEAPAVRISLDHDVQQAAEEAVNLRRDMQTMLVAIRPSTGEILAVAQSDLADREGDLALSGQYPPGSTFKIISAGLGIEDQGLTPDSIVPCPGSMNLYGRTVNNYNQFSLGNVPLELAFARSCNTTFADISTKADPGELKEIGRSFGLGMNYEIPGINTVTGSIPEGETPLERTEAGYGQGLTLASPFGMALVSATVAAGKTPNPTFISGHETKESGDAKPLKKETIDQLRRVMRAVVLPGGTAGGMRAGGEIYGKTGEAEITGGSHAWFTGYRDDIAWATLVVLGGGSEAAVAVTDEFLVRLDELDKGK